MFIEEPFVGTKRTTCSRSRHEQQTKSETFVAVCFEKKELVGIRGLSNKVHGEVV